MNAVVAAYLGYLALSIGLTAWVGRTLFSSGQAFLERVFAREGDLATSVNRLLLTGFYLVNAGFIALHLRTYGTVTDAREVIELLSAKIGVVVLVLGGMHFLNLYVFSRMWRGRTTTTPVDPPSAPWTTRYPTTTSMVDGAPGAAVVPALAGASVATSG
jgi:hypothetical protein